MQDGAHPHEMAEVFHYVNGHFNDNLIVLDFSKHTGSGINWPSYSPDFTTCDFSPWRIPEYYGVLSFSIKTAELKQYISAACKMTLDVMSTQISANFVLILRLVPANGRTIKNIII